jgi:hypothetical protein
MVDTLFSITWYLPTYLSQVNKGMQILFSFHFSSSSLSLLVKITCTQYFCKRCINSVFYSSVVLYFSFCDFSNCRTVCSGTTLARRWNDWTWDGHDRNSPTQHNIKCLLLNIFYLIQVNILLPAPDLFNRLHNQNTRVHSALYHNLLCKFTKERL